MEPIVRLQGISLTNIKNVNNGRIEMPGSHKKTLTHKNAEILGLYGQNGSGKTAVIDSLYFIQRIMNGDSLPFEIADYIDAREETAEIFAEFAIFMEELVYEVGYRVAFLRVNQQQVVIQSESLTSAKISSESRSNRAIFMEYQYEDGKYIFLPKKRLDELVAENKEYKMDLLVAKKLAKKSNCSFIFGEHSREVFEQIHSSAFQEYAKLIMALYRFAFSDLFVIRNTHSGVISANLVLPMAFKIEETNLLGAELKGDFSVSLTQPTVLSMKQKEILDHIVNEINTVLTTIIPGLFMAVKDYGKQLLDNGKEGIKIELLSVRGDITIPIRMESEGIIKIISILNALIQAFSDPSICLAIDELDAGVFEYMLGELLDIFKKSAKGQLIFTSHNLRALEMLDKESIMFSTVNPKNRYIHMKNVKSSNNLRDVYLRGITLGGQNEEIYAQTDSIKIARAFRKAGRSLQYENK